MYLHIGGNQMVDMSRIVAIFQAHPRKTEKSNPLRQYYKKLILLQEGQGKQRVKCYVVTEDCIYGTPISLATIVKRYKGAMQRKVTSCQ